MHTVDDVQLLKRCLTLAGYSIEGLGGVSDEWSHEDVMRGARKILRDYLEGWRRIAELEAENEGLIAIDTSRGAFVRIRALLKIEKDRAEKAEAREARLRWMAGWLCQCEELCHWYDYFRCHPMMYEQVNWRQDAHIEAYATRHQAFEDISSALEGRPDFDEARTALAQEPRVEKEHNIHGGRNPSEQPLGPERGRWDDMLDAGVAVLLEANKPDHGVGCEYGECATCTLRPFPHCGDKPE